MASYRSTPKDNVYYETYGAVASSSGQGGMEEHISRSMRKVQSKDLKSGCLIGKGLSSIVYETTLEGKSYARKDFLRVPSDIFEREAAALVGLDHPNVVRTYCWTVDEGSCSLVVELMDNDLLNFMQKIKDSRRKQSSGSNSSSQTTHLIDLHKFIKDGRNAPKGTVSESAAATPLVYLFDLSEALQIMLQVAEGVKYLHDKGVAHGNLKPKNILVASNEAVSAGSLDENMIFKVADFGLFWTKMKSRTLVSRRTRNLELARWRAPELLELTGLREDEHESSTDSDWDSDSSDETIGVLAQKFTFKDMASADIYNFAITCSQILTGEDPYPELSLNDLVRAILGGLRPRLPLTCPAQLSSLLKRCWGKKTQRPSFEDVFSELKDLQDTMVNFSHPFSSLELELVPEHSAASEQSGGESKSSPVREIHLKVDVPVADDEHSVKEIPADSSKGTLVLKQPRMSGKALGMSGFIQKLMSRMSNEKKKKKGISIPTEFYVDKLKQRPPELDVLPRFSSSDLKRMTNNFDKENIRRQKGRYTHKRRAEDERKKNPFAAWGKARDGQAPQLKGAHWFSFDDVKRMTNNFSEDNVLGAGGYGKVYKGIEAGTGAMLAVKRAQEGSKQGAAEFKKEIEILSRVHHNNLVGLVGFCFEKSEQMLVYEYMPNGTLTEWLHGVRSDEPLDWDRRLLIALGAAQGISYLHHHADPQIIHRDVKSCNILLDGDLNSKVADFGLSMLVPDVKDGSSKPTIKGTMGYLDPEYYMTNVLSPKSDVYSFGVVLLELLTARRPVSYRGHIVETMRTRYDSSGMPGVEELLDPVLLGGSTNSSEEMETLLKMALVCVEDSSLERPSMHEVVKQLEVLVGPKAQLMPGRRGRSMGERMESRERRASLEMDRVLNRRGSRGSSGWQVESFKYSGGFVTEPVEPK